jgi:hypothetical protein
MREACIDQNTKRLRNLFGDYLIVILSFKFGSVMGKISRQYVARYVARYVENLLKIECFLNSYCPIKRKLSQLKTVN